MLTVSSDQLNARAHPAANNWTDVAQVRKINSLRLSPNLNSLLSYKSLRIPAHRFWSWRHSHPQSHFYLGFLLWHLWLSHPPVRAWTPALMSAPIHALSRKVLSLTKPKDKIYKTKKDNIKKILPQLYNTIIVDYLMPKPLYRNIWKCMLYENTFCW